MKRRALALINVALIPYVVLRFPREAKRYVIGCVRVIVGG